MPDHSSTVLTESNEPWYRGITRYQWLVLAIASAGWVFDVYEGQIFNITRNQLLADIVGERATDIKRYGDIFLAVFLLGGTIGGLAAGSLADRFGRRPILVVTILMYSLFSGLTYFATELWHVGVLRFLVSMGVGGEWAVAAALVSEVFPPRARAHASGIFHASSVLGTWMAALAGMAVGQEWRYAYLFGILPALLILWVRATVREPEKWQATAEEAKRSEAKKSQLGSFKNLLSQAPWNRRAVLGMLLAAVGLGTFWAVTVAGQDLAREQIIRHARQSRAVDQQEPLAANADAARQSMKQIEEEATERAKFAYGIVQTTGGGLGLLAFGPLCARFGRRPTFVAFHLLALVIVPITCFAPQNYFQLLLILPVFGFLTLGMHAGYAIYFPELFPTHLRATGVSFCFNGGRVVAVPVLLLSGQLKSMPGVELRWAVTALGGLFLFGALLMAFLPETNRKELPE